MMQPFLAGRLAQSVIVLAGLCAGCARAADEPLLAGIFAEHMVVQRDRPIEVWGQANADEQVLVTIKPCAVASPRP